MLDYIKRIIFAYNLCFKYKLRLIINLDCREVAYFHYKGIIEISLFSENFYVSLLHELAHYFDHKVSGGYRTMSHYNRQIRATLPYCVNQVDWNKTLYCEARANRYALKMLRVLGKYDETCYPWLKFCMTTYIANFNFEGLEVKTRLADLDYKINRYLLY